MLKLSIVVIGYNVQEYISRCLTSILKQFTDECELIFVDDGSTDHTETIVKNLITNYKNCYYYKKKNGGANSARIEGFKRAKGTYLTFIDADDWIQDNAIGTYLKESLSEKDLIIFRHQEVYFDDQVHIPVRENIVQDCMGLEYLDCILNGRLSHTLWNKLYKREFLEKIDFGGIPFITLGDDLAGLVHVGVSQPTVLGVNLVIYNYYMRKTSSSKKFSEKSIDIIIAMEYIEEELRKNGLLNDKYQTYLEYHIFRTFLFYVVRNSNPGSVTQQKILQFCKQKGINFNNKMIKAYLKEHSLEKILCKIYLSNFILGCKYAKIYLFLRNVR